MHYSHPNLRLIVAEKIELDARIGKLTTVIDASDFSGLPESEQERLVRQLHYMGHYTAVLGERIAAYARTAATAT